ncbi:MAG TPA: TerB N-terminal domain-containing protein, partial [Polyangiaceae bacterium]|nr:TerB N-terminal domain-containing protein [Polyangiaceae bacterium]
GLERRALIDAPRNREELRQIYAEVERLLTHYSGNSSFRSYASEFLAFLRLKLATRKLYEENPGAYPLTYEVPAEIRVALSQLTRDQKPMSGDWAISWLMNNREDVRLRTPAQRCEEEFKTLFVMRYQKKYGEGLLLKPSKKRLSISYRAASAGLGQIEASLGDLMDVTSLKRPINQLQAIADTCMDDLDAYSRFVGRRPGDAKSLEALALLPSELVASAETPEMVTFRHWVNERLAQSELSVIGGKELLSQWPSSDSDRLSKSEAVALAQMLETLGVGIEPDVRFAGTPISADGHAVLFRITGARSEAPSAEYKSCTLLMHLAAVVAGADGTVTDSEKEHLEEQMESTMQLAAHERRRLRAHLAWLLAEQPTATGLKTKLQKLPAGTRHQIAQFAVAIAGADGRIDPAEVKVLGKVYSALGMDASTVYADINSMAGGPPTAPVTVQIGTASAAGFKIPAPGSAASVAPSKGQAQAFQLDAKKVQDRLKSTREVSSLLADIFTEPAEPERSVTKVEAAATANESVGTKMARLLRELENRSTLTRGEFEDIVGRFALMPAGAIDLLNETALESHDAPLLDGEDPIQVDQDILREMINAST